MATSCSTSLPGTAVAHRLDRRGRWHGHDNLGLEAALREQRRRFRARKGRGPLCSGGVRAARLAARWRVVAATSSASTSTRPATASSLRCRCSRARRRWREPLPGARTARALSASPDQRAGARACDGFRDFERDPRRRQVELSRALGEGRSRADPSLRYRAARACHGRGSRRRADRAPRPRARRRRRSTDGLNFARGVA